MIAHDSDGIFKETSDVRRVSVITDNAGVSVRLSDVGFGKGINRVGGWLGITLVLHHADAGAKSVGGVRVTFVTEAMRGVEEEPSFPCDSFEFPNLYLNHVSSL